MINWTLSSKCRDQRWAQQTWIQQVLLHPPVAIHHAFWQVLKKHLNVINTFHKEISTNKMFLFSTKVGGLFLKQENNNQPPNKAFFAEIPSKLP